VTEAELQKGIVRKRRAIGTNWRAVQYSVAEARRALPYVASVASDVAEAYQQVRFCRGLLEQGPSPHERLLLANDRDAALRRLNAAIDECNAVGADLLDLAEGIVAFAANVNERRASLIWRLGEPIARAWSGLEERSCVGETRCRATPRRANVRRKGS
jgi:hypothetical protein